MQCIIIQYSAVRDWNLQMQCMVFTMVVTKTQCGCGGEAHFRCRRGSCLPDVSKLQQNMGARPELGLSRSKAKSIFVQTNKKQEK